MGVMKHKIDEGDDSKKDGETKEKEKLQQKEQGSTQKLLAIYKKVMKAKIDKGDGATKEKEQLQQKEHDPNQNVMKYWLKSLEQQMAIYKKVMKDKIDEGDDSKDDGETKDKEQLQQKEHDSTQNLMNYWLKNSEQLLAIYKKVMASKIDHDSETKKTENSNVDGRKKSIDVEIREPNREIKKD